MPCTLRIRDDLSVRDIRELAQQHLVRVTPHVGNWTPARLVLPTLGVTVLCVDHTIGVCDRNANPHLLIQNGGAHQICDHPDRLTTHAYVTDQVNGSAHPVGASLASVHIGTLRTLFPGTPITTHTEHLLEQHEATLSILKLVTRLSPGYAWWRFVTEDGTVHTCRRSELPDSWEALAHRIFPLTSARSGWLLHNRVAILMDVIEQSESGRNPEMYHLSGPDMVRYLSGEMRAISRMYDYVRRSLDFRQETITINLVPFASFRFATRASQADACERLCHELARTAPREHVLREYLHDASDVLAASESQNHFSQHDLLATGERVIACPIAEHWTMQACAEHVAILQQLA